MGSILGHLRSGNIYKFAYIGHGSEGALTAISDPDGQGIVEGIILADRYTPFRIAEMHIIACESNDDAADWARNVSRAGWLRTMRGRTSLFTGEFVDQGGAP